MIKDNKLNLLTKVIGHVKLSACLTKSPTNVSQILVSTLRRFRIMSYRNFQGSGLDIRSMIFVDQSLRINFSKQITKNKTWSITKKVSFFCYFFFTHKKNTKSEFLIFKNVAALNIVSVTSLSDSS